MNAAATAWQALPVAPSQLGESPFWHPDEGALYWCDITGRALHRWHPASAVHTAWPCDSEPACAAPLLGGGALLVAFRDGLYRFDTASGRRRRLAVAPYDPRVERFNDGRADPQGRFWSGTVYEPREPACAALYRWSRGRLDRVAGGVTTSNGLAFSPDGRTLYWSDTRAHRIWALDFDGGDGSLSRRRLFAEFPLEGQQDAAAYVGRPDGAAVDAEGAYWVAMYAGQRLLRLASDGRLLQALPLPVRCPTMPCFGGADLRTLYVTSARAGRPADELAQQPAAGSVFEMRVDVPGLPVHFAA